MKIIYFYQYFSTSNGSWGTRVHEFGREWVKAGHSVRVISSIYAKSDLHARHFIEQQWFDGVEVTVINVRVDNKQGILQRVFTFLAYAAVSSWYALTARYDVAIASSGPITVGVPGLIAKWLRGKTMVFEVRDLWPQGAIEMGLLRHPLLIRLAYRFERMCYAAADRIIALSPGMQQEIAAKAPGKPVFSVTNAANLNLFGTPCAVALPVYGLEYKSYALYAGNIGKVNHVEWMYEAAKQLQQAGSRIKIVFIGDGQLKAALQERARQDNLTHLVFIGLIPKQELVGFVQAALVSLTPLADKPVLATSSPNKFFESLAAGVPVIQTTNGWMKTFVETHQVGFTVSPQRPADLFDTLMSLERHPEICSEMGQRATAVAREAFDVRILAEQMLRYVLSDEKI